MYLKNKNKKIKRNKKNIILMVLILSSIIFIKTATNLEKFYLKYTKNIIEKQTITIINDSIDESMLNDLYKNDIIRIKKNKEDQIETVEYNNYLINKYTDQIIKTLEEELKKDTYNIKIPITAMLDNNLLNSISPKIKIKTNNISSVICNIDLNAKEYGINNVIIEIYLTIIVERKITLPLLSDNIKIEMNNPISYIVINGKIPDYYKNDIETNNDKTSIENKN